MIFVNYFKRLSCGCLYSLSTILTLHVTAVTVSKYWLELGRMRLTELIYADTRTTTRARAVNPEKRSAGIQIPADFEF